MSAGLADARTQAGMAASTPTGANVHRRTRIHPLDTEDASLLEAAEEPTVSLRGGATDVMVELLGRLKIATYFALWYALNIVYNSKFIFGRNDKKCNVYP